MGGYGLFVWSSFALTAVVLLLNFVLPVRAEKDTLSRARKLSKRK